MMCRTYRDVSCASAVRSQSPVIARSRSRIWSRPRTRRVPVRSPTSSEPSSRNSPATSSLRPDSSGRPQFAKPDLTMSRSPHTAFLAFARTSHHTIFAFRSLCASHPACTPGVRRHEAVGPSRLPSSTILHALHAHLQGKVLHVWADVAPRLYAAAAAAQWDPADRRSLWVPKTLSPYATWEYSRIRPPRRSRRRTRTFAPRAGGCGRPAGGLCCGARCGRCRL